MVYTRFTGSSFQLTQPTRVRREIQKKKMVLLNKKLHFCCLYLSMYGLTEKYCKPKNIILCKKTFRILKHIETPHITQQNWYPSLFVFSLYMGTTPKRGAYMQLYGSKCVKKTWPNIIININRRAYRNRMILNTLQKRIYTYIFFLKKILLLYRY